MNIIHVDKLGDFEIIDASPEAVARLLYGHAKVRRVWYDYQTGEFAVLTTEGISTFRLDFPNDESAFS